MNKGNQLNRIAVIYDGNFFLHVSNYYLYNHKRAARISLEGLHKFIRSEVAAHFDYESELCPIVDAHYFRGRLPSKIVEERNKLLSERVFEDILIRQGITTHYIPVTGGSDPSVDIGLVLETYALTVLNQYDIVVLIAGNGEFVPLVRRICALGTKVVILGWDFQYQDENGEQRETRTSQALKSECTYPINMADIIDNPGQTPPAEIDALFVPVATERSPHRPVTAPSDKGSNHVYEGTVKRIKDGYGFITAPQLDGDLFFHHLDLDGISIDSMNEGDEVSFTLGKNDKGATATNIKFLD